MGTEWHFGIKNKTKKNNGTEGFSRSEMHDAHQVSPLALILSFRLLLIDEARPRKNLICLLLMWETEVCHLANPFQKGSRKINPTDSAEAFWLACHVILSEGGKSDYADPCRILTGRTVPFRRTHRLRQLNLNMDSTHQLHLLQSTEEQGLGSSGSHLVTYGFLPHSRAHLHGVMAERNTGMRENLNTTAPQTSIKSLKDPSATPWYTLNLGHFTYLFHSLINE